MHYSTKQDAKVEFHNQVDYCVGTGRAGLALQKEQLLIVVNQYTEVYYAYIGLVIITFIYGGYKSNLMVEDAETRKKLNHDLYLFIIALIIAIILNFN